MQMIGMTRPMPGISRNFPHATNSLMFGLLKAAWDDLIGILLACYQLCVDMAEQLQDEIMHWDAASNNLLKGIRGS